ncbi:UV-B-induced protein At3g17800, chloroplastic-like [Cucurbita pepo subsp. pepo]|uniref:UV-B-induced protein At3g17800, chloroplastic-like n=1 Tax=Cucurbita pepo subsp. pepo TaxID=3664 RepID=UPI000C9D8EA4|nr:UV-B-induced protein At3g17800, chloroplastic-like [Cucurbita pepo subsp. pepo]XP_023549054.1 UV-B-induced protein At3g17800, chloroplastic-like [Cucurbita pepo subsp. pepo]XP_023549055.1 UV-B-induced protein At3g17800, chloroplastic-like [Cucurbita pepo subsp. pepo]
MDHSLSLHISLPSTPIFNSNRSDFALGFLAGFSFWKPPLTARPRSLAVLASAGSSHCEFGSFNTPLNPRSSVGKHLTRVLQNYRQLFHVSVQDELKRLADRRDAAVDRMLLAAGSDEALLHRRIAQLKEQECQIAVQDVMYMLIFYRFSEIRVNLIPKLSRCVYNGRLEIWPCKDWELESIYELEVLEMIKEHITAVIGLRADSSVTDNWAMTNIKQAHLGHVYVASILYGYFLKSALLRHHLEQRLAIPNVHRNGGGQKTFLQSPEMCLYGFRNLLSGCHRSNVLPVAHNQEFNSNQEMEAEKLKRFLTGFDSEALQRCAKLKSKEAVSLLENHSRALLGNEEVGFVERDEVIATSFSSLKRLVLEAVAFGSFLWDAEEYVDAIYKLKEN